jgi:hypothetical protein
VTASAFERGFQPSTVLAFSFDPGRDSLRNGTTKAIPESNSPRNLNTKFGIFHVGTFLAFGPSRSWKVKAISLIDIAGGAIHRNRSPLALGWVMASR